MRLLHVLPLGAAAACEHSGQRACEVCTTATQSGVSQPIRRSSSVQGRAFFPERAVLPDGGTGNADGGCILFDDAFVMVQ